jgi:hypothetical protein
VGEGTLIELEYDRFGGTGLELDGREPLKLRGRARCVASRGRHEELHNLFAGA